jgi:hypothetical protein
MNIKVFSKLPEACTCCVVITTGAVLDIEMTGEKTHKQSDEGSSNEESDVGSAGQDEQADGEDLKSDDEDIEEESESSDSSDESQEED